MDVEFKLNPKARARWREIKTLIVGAVIGAAIVLTIAGWVRPRCPQEDSCRPDYQHHWYGNGWTGVPDPKAGDR